MSSCEVMEIAVSALIDDELSPSERLRTIDHLVDCPGCRELYRRSRTLSEVVTDPRSELDEEPPDEGFWRRISAASSFGERPARRPSSMWWSRLAAALLLGLGLALLLPSISENGAGTDDSLELILEGDRGQMSEKRFVALTAELLKADRRYHRKMLEVMLAVDEAVHGREGTLDEGLDLGVERESERRPENEDRPSEPLGTRRAKRPHRV